MRVLVTGHNGYIGSVMTPLLEQAGHEVVGLDFDLFAACTFSEPAVRDRVDSQGRARRRGGRPRRLRRGAAPGGGLQRSDRRPEPAGDLRHQPSGLGPARREGQAGGRAALPLLLVLQPLWQGRRRRAARRERRRSPRSRRTAGRRFSPSATSRRWPTTRSARPTCATRPPTAYRRACASTSSSTTSSGLR